ncbi:cell division cycle protein 123-like [Haliotis rubra]|uniref:cell division cycle protein 123-like n=1 Tax=Haliotis rubra TaxID=36100 RepID=UPI001EE56FAE|nr:cell division cycle protein 123-like [Haliotis rubra]XP_046561508.1 cell division cycle protein 123-like [Haliotis rubra]XP_046561509.1 cell division cycle protein 123-like [Haliotis rubra]
MASLTEQLKNCKLKKVTDPIKDFSSPKTAGYMSQEEITLYQNSVIDVNTEKWMHVLKELTFPTELCPLKIEEANLFVKIFENCYRNLDAQQICDLNWRETLTSDEKLKIEDVTKRLESVMEQFTARDGFAFVKTSSRSAKDAPMVQRRFKDVYHKFLTEFPEDEQSENIQITCLLRAAFEGLKVKTAEDVVDMMLRSERIYQDMLLALKIESRFEENFVVRKFVDVDVDMEFRGFVFGGELVALSQYNYLIFSQRLLNTGDHLKDIICKYFNDKVRPLMKEQDFPTAYIIDFAVCDNGDKLWVIEINPFAETTDGGLFSWQHERHLLEGKEGFQFRIVKRPKPGAKAMLPQSIKALLK